MKIYLDFVNEQLAIIVLRKLSEDISSETINSEDVAVSFPEAGCHHVSPIVDTEPFTARMRFHQSWYRHYRLGLEPGHNPHAGGAVYGNMLHEEDGRQGRNFLTEEAFAHARERFPETGNDSGTRRLYCNMLGSQTMCFNLFGLMKSAPAPLATALFRSLPGVPGDVTVTDVRFEYAPDKKQHLDDATSFDAFIAYERPGGVRGFAGIETKLTEPFSRKKYAFACKYSLWMKQHRDEWWWQPGAEAHFPAPVYNQLWRNHLLAFSMLHQTEPEYTEGFCVVAYPVQDEQCGRAMAKYRQHLLPRGGDTLLEWPVQAIHDAWEVLLPVGQHQRWLDEFRARYLELDLSEAAWRAFQER